MGLFSSDEPVTVEVLDRTLQCVVCQHGEFHKRSAQLNTAGLTFLDLDWANRSADLYVCARCGYIHWFVRE